MTWNCSQTLGWWDRDVDFLIQNITRNKDKKIGNQTAYLAWLLPFWRQDRRLSDWTRWWSRYPRLSSGHRPPFKLINEMISRVNTNVPKKISTIKAAPSFFFLPYRNQRREARLCWRTESYHRRRVRPGKLLFLFFSSCYHFIKDRLCFWLDRTHLFRNAFPLDIRNEDATTDVGVSTFDDHDTKSSRSLNKNT